MMIVLLGAGLTVVISFIANGQDKLASPWEVVNNALRNESQPESGDIINALELIDKYSQTQAKLRTSYLSKEEDKSEREILSIEHSEFKQGVKYELFEKIEIRTDSKNYYYSHKRWETFLN